MPMHTPKSQGDAQNARLPVPSAPRAKHNQQQSPFFSTLPPEIREHIYHYTFPPPARLEIHGKCFGKDHSRFRYTSGRHNIRNWHEIMWHQSGFTNMSESKLWKDTAHVPHIFRVCWRM